MSHQLRAWEVKNHLVLIRGASEKSFCAGGDIEELMNQKLDLVKDWFRAEYLMFDLIKHYKKPYVAVMDGITMGGGVGISVNGKFCVATERTVFAMPETAIGLFPDVASTYFLSRLPGKLGLFLGLTGTRLRGADVLTVGLATHFISSSQIVNLEKQLLASNGENVHEILDTFSEKPEVSFTLEPHLPLINRAFSAETVEDIVQSLKDVNSEFSQNIARLLAKMSPTSLKITKKLIDKGHEMSFRECLQLDYRLLVNLYKKHSDFNEGVRAMLIDKDRKPKWSPSTLEEVCNSQVDSYFERLAEEDELKFISNEDIK